MLHTLSLTDDPEARRYMDFVNSVAQTLGSKYAADYGLWGVFSVGEDEAEAVFLERVMASDVSVEFAADQFHEEFGAKYREKFRKEKSSTRLGNQNGLYFNSNQCQAAIGSMCSYNSPLMAVYQLADGRYRVCRKDKAAEGETFVHDRESYLKYKREQKGAAKAQQNKQENQ